jgi:hypothetical protein
MNESGLYRDDVAIRMAVANLTHAIESSRRFPMNVFSAEWHEFVFFDSDLVFKSEFASDVRTLLEIEGSICVCLANLFKMAQGVNLDQCCLFLNDNITNEQYVSQLAGTNHALGLLYDVDAFFGCTSNEGLWTIYCDRGSDIAVMAFRDNGQLEKFKPVITSLGALSIKEALARPPGYGFAPAHVADIPVARDKWSKWIAELRKAYEGI